MSKQKIILLIFILLLVIGAFLIFLFLRNEKTKLNNTDDDFLNRELIPLTEYEKTKAELGSFREPTREVVFPYVPPTDETIKNDKEITIEIDQYDPKKSDGTTTNPNNPDNSSNEQILQLLKNPELAN